MLTGKSMFHTMKMNVFSVQIWIADLKCDEAHGLIICKAFINAAQGAMSGIENKSHNLNNNYVSANYNSIFD
jgi:hypothetical protein